MYKVNDGKDIDSWQRELMTVDVRMDVAFSRKNTASMGKLEMVSAGSSSAVAILYPPVCSHAAVLLF